MREKFCPVCGQKGITGIFCDKHTPELDLVLKDIIIKICSTCKKHYAQKRWMLYENLNQLIIQTIKKELMKKDRSWGRAKIEIMDSQPISKSTDEYEVKITGKEEFLITIKTTKEQCVDCSREKSNYFVSTAQVRLSKFYENPTIDLIVEIQKRFESLLKKEQNTNELPQVIKQKNGFDVKLSSKKLADHVGKQLILDYGGELNKTSKLQSRDSLTSKDLFRDTLKIELFGVRKNEILKQQKDILVVVGVDKQIKCKNVVSGKIQYLEEENYKKILPLSTRITRVKPTSYVIGEDFQEHELKNYEGKINQRIKVIIMHGIAYKI